LLIFVPCHRKFSLDARRDPRLRTDHVPAWALWLLRAQVAVPYIYGGLVKLNADWLHGQPMQIWMSQSPLRGVIPMFGEHWLALIFSYGGLLLDLLVVPALLWKRTRWFAFGGAVLFHLANSLMFRIGVFPWLMICATTLFLSPDWPRRLFRLPPASRPPARAAAPVPQRLRKIAIGGVVTYFVFQILFPLRFLLYPGNVDWTREGWTFAWRMMLSQKRTALRFFVVDPARGQTMALDPTQLLSPRQIDKMADDPEMMREFAAHVKDQLQEQGYPDWEVHVFALCSLNGRKPQLVVDANVDLGAQPRTILSKPWIAPLREPRRYPPWDVPQRDWEKHVDSTL
jgi:hypothetical protein